MALACGWTFLGKRVHVWKRETDSDRSSRDKDRKEGEEKRLALGLFLTPCTYSFNHQLFIECLLCISHCAEHRRGKMSILFGRICIYKENMGEQTWLRVPPRARESSEGVIATANSTVYCGDGVGRSGISDGVQAIANWPFLFHAYTVSKLSVIRDILLD